MPEYLSPGVYIEEVSTGPVPIQGVSTTTTGFVGQTVRGPLRAQFITSWLDFQRWYGGYTDPNKMQGYLPYAVKGFFDNGGQRAFIARVPVDAYPAGSASLPAAGAKLTASAVGPGAWANSVVLKLAKASQAGPDRPWVSLSVFYYDGAIPMKGTAFLDPDIPGSLIDPGFVAPSLTERFDNLAADPQAPNYFAGRVNPVSRLIALAAADGVDAAALATWFGSVTDAVTVPMTSAAPAAGTFNPFDLSAYVGTGDDTSPPETRTGLCALAPISEIAMLCVPDQGSVPGIGEAMIQQCESLRSRVAILDSGATSGSLDTLRPLMDTTFGATYFPWITVMDPRTNAPLDIPPGGHIVGMIARTDIARGVWKAPANETLAGPLTQNTAGKTPLTFRVTDGVQGLLNPRGVNCLRDFRDTGRGLRVWGGRTMSSDGQWRYLKVRRLFVYVEQSVFYGTQWVVFEPNDPYTWNRVVSSVSAFLNGLWRSGGLMGSTAEQAYQVICDNSTMSQDDIDNGRLICMVAIAPVKPAEFVIFRISQKTADASQS